MRAADAERRYKMVLKAENEKNYLVMVTPKLEEDKESFSTAWIYLDKNYLLPKRIYLHTSTGKAPRISSSREPRQWRGRSSILRRPKIPKPWKIERNPGEAMAANPGLGNQKAPHRLPIGQSVRQALAPK